MKVAWRIVCRGGKLLGKGEDYCLEQCRKTSVKTWIKGTRSGNTKKMVSAKGNFKINRGHRIFNRINRVVLGTYSFLLNCLYM